MVTLTKKLQILGSIGVVMFLMSCLFVAGANAAQPLVLKISHSYSSNDIRDNWAKLFSQKVEERTKGAIKFQIYPSSVLFKAYQQFEAMQEGALDLMVFPLIYAGGKVPEFNITSMPCFPKNYQAAMKWGDAEIGKMIQKICLDNGMRALSWGWMLGGIGSKKKLVAVPSDFKGITGRGAGKPNEEMLLASGAAITSMPSSEVYFALQTGVLDAIFTTYSSFQSYRLYEVLDYLVLGRENHVYSSHNGIFIATKTWAKLTPEQQNIMTTVGREVEKWFFDEVQKEDDRAAKIFSENKVKIHYLTDAEFKLWEDLARKTAWKNFAEKAKDGKRLMDAALAVQ